MKIRKKPKYEQVIVTIPNGTLADNVITKDYQPDANYGFINRVWAKPMNLANQVYVNIQLWQGGDVLLDPIPHELWSGGSGVSPNQQMRDLSEAAPCKNKYKVGAKTPAGAANTNADIVVVFVFELIDELAEVART